MTKTKESFQVRFFTRLNERYRSRSKMVEEVGRILHLGKDAVYRRLRGDTSLTADELYKLTEYYRIDLSGQRSFGDNTPIMKYPNGARRIRSADQYFLQLRENTKMLAGLPNVSIDYATPELPFFYELSHPLLASFKVFIYGITTWGFKDWQRRKFHPDLISCKTHELINLIVGDSYRISGRELWSVNLLDVTLRQFRYLLQLECFEDPRTAGLVIKAIEEVVDHLEKMAMAGKRFPMNSQPTSDSPDFTVFHNELSNTNNAIIVKSRNESYTFNTLVNPNYMIGEDERVVGDVQRWFDNLVANANPLGKNNVKYTNIYFNQLRAQIAKTKQLLDGRELLF